MEGKLIKQEKEYYALYNNEGVFISDVNGGSLANRLSLKNCEAIENGYDLEEISSSLRKEFEIKYNTSKGIPPRGGGYIIRGLDYQVGVIDGFQKALEILADKKYTETELYRAFLINSAGNDTTLRNFFEQTVLPMFNDNEWDVTFNPDEKDADGCLILKSVNV